jgi:hypothetical protein
VTLVLWGLVTHGKYSVSGDEPHYLMVSRSLWLDGDLDLANNYAHGDAFGEGTLEAGPHARYTSSGLLYSVHDIGLPVVLTPLYAVTTSLSTLPPPRLLQRLKLTPGLLAYSLISLFLIVVSAASATLVRSSLLAVGVTPVSASALVLVAWLSVPVLANSFVVFPEVPMLLVCSLAVRLWATQTGRALFSQWMVVGVALGLSPWLHRKFIVLVACVALILVAKHWPALRTWPARQLAGVAAALSIPSLLLVWWTWLAWGSAGGPLMAGGPPFEWDAFKAGVLGLLLDRENGLLVWAPAYALLPAAVAGASTQARWWLLPTLVLYILSSAHGQWWAGFSPVGRFLLPIVPMVVFVAGTSRPGELVKGCFYLLLVPQAIITAYAWQHTRSLWPQGDGVNRVLAGLFGSGADAVLPSLRAESPDFGRALLLGSIVVCANTLVVIGDRRRAAKRGRSGRQR